MSAGAWRFHEYLAQPPIPRHSLRIDSTLGGEPQADALLVAGAKDGVHRPGDVAPIRRVEPLGIYAHAQGAYMQRERAPTYTGGRQTRDSPFYGPRRGSALSGTPGSSCVRVRYSPERAARGIRTN
jgi:hypothetical protein